MKKLILLVLALSLANLLNACSGPVEGLSRELDTDLSGGKVVRSVDTHGGFHGDGAAFVELSFTGKAAERLARDIPGLDGWEPLPLTDNLHRAVYGESGRGSLMGDEDIPDVPPVEDGWYCFVDRNSRAADPKDDAELFERYSYNFTVAIYDRANDAVYVYQLDT